jgi:5'-3' exonuclease
MGIKHFFSWFKKKYGDSIHKLAKNETVLDLETVLETPVSIDNYMIDLNGVFHNSAQKIYEYGNHKPRQRLLGKHRQPRLGGVNKQIECFKDVCATIEKTVNIIKPTKRLILCVDGPAPLSKQVQQRQRRFVSANLKEEENYRTFDSNCITPGTKFMDHLTKYIDWYIRKRLSESGSPWEHLEIIFSNEKAPGEGEHKCISYIRQYGNKDESYCINAMDADLIMLTLGTHYNNFYVLRDEPMDSTIEYYLVDIGNARKNLREDMYWGDDCVEEYTINDFILMCFTVGNDFLPHIPAIEIIEGGIDFMIEIYKKNCSVHGHLTTKKESGIRFRRRSLVHFLRDIAKYEKEVLEGKLKHKDRFFPDLLLEKNAVYTTDGKYNLDIEQYRKDYYKTNLSEIKHIKTLCHEYLEGMQWVLSYYTKGVPNWKWRYLQHYAPFAHTLSEHVMSFKFPKYGSTSPTLPFIQLICVLPPKSADLLPNPLNTLLTDEKSPLIPYCPSKFDIDISGMRQEWEGTVLLPIMDYTLVETNYMRMLKDIDTRDLKRNILGKSFVYKRCNPYEFTSYYGNLKCRVNVVAIDL